MSALEPEEFFRGLLDGIQDKADAQFDYAELHWPADIEKMLDALSELTHEQAKPLLPIMKAYAADLRNEYKAIVSDLRGRRAESPREARRHVAFLADRLTEVGRLISCLLIETQKPKSKNPGDGVLTSAKEALQSWERDGVTTTASRKLRGYIEQAEGGKWPVDPVEFQRSGLPELRLAHMAERQAAHARETTTRKALFALARAVLESGDPTLGAVLDELEVFVAYNRVPLREATLAYYRLDSASPAMTDGEPRPWNEVRAEMDELAAAGDIEGAKRLAEAHRSIWPKPPRPAQRH
jgi:hypothetical protein